MKAILGDEPSPKLLKKFNEYDTFHKNSSNHLLHGFGIPAIVLSLFGFASLITIKGHDGGISLNWILWGVTTLWYFYLDPKVTLFFMIATGFCAWLSAQFSIQLLVLLFVSGWAAQLYGHYHFEKNRPAFTKNLEQLLIGPIWLFCRAILYYSPNSSQSKNH